MPKVSVILPAYNAEKYIKEAMDSILCQTFRDLELIVLNDCSRDSTEQIITSCKDARLVYVKNAQNMGVAATLNRGLSLAKGEYIARMDADDISLPERLEKQVAYLDAHPETAVLGVGVERFGEEIAPQTRLFSADPRQMQADLFFSCGLAHPGVMLRKSVIAALGGYDREYEGLEDYELWCRVSRKHQVCALPTVLLRYRVHGGQVTKNPSEKYITRMGRLKQRQLEELGLPTEGDLAESYCRYCLGQHPAELQATADLCRFLESALAANEKAGIYDGQTLRRTFRSLTMAAALRLPFGEAWALCARTSLLRRSALAARFLKKKLR